MNKRKAASSIVPEISGTGLSCCGYYRVSTGRQAESDLSIPDQRRQIAAFCLAKGWTLAEHYIEAGASATDDNRPEFQKMMERATDDDRPYDCILVHSYSRFFRDSFSLEMFVRKLAKAGVRLISITQELGDDPAQIMMRQIISLFDEYQSRENGKHVLRAMKENARAGFYNGSPLPLGYSVAEVEKRGIRVKKKVVIDPVEAEIVKLIFRLYGEGDGQSGPIGIKKIAAWLNERGYRTRGGARFGVSGVHIILTNPAYVGEMSFNKRCSKTLREKPVAEHIKIEVPTVIDGATFRAVQATLERQNPRSQAPRVVSGPILLTGLAQCATCGGAMTLRTGTSKTGTVHRYYACSTCARQGKSACPGRSIRMDRLDGLVVDHLVERLFVPDRLRELLASLMARRGERAAEVDGRVSRLRAEATDAADKLGRLYAMVENGVTDLDDILKDRIAALKSARDRAVTALERLRDTTTARMTIDPNKIERFSVLMRENLTNGPIPFRKAYLRAVVERIEVDDAIVRIIGDNADLEQVIAAGSINEGVRRSVPKWRARRDSNS